MEPDVLGRRIAAALIDVLLVFLLFLAVAVLAGQTSSGGSGFSANLTGLPALLFLGLAFVYYWATEARFGATVGKRLLGLRVVGADGAAAGPGPTFVRNLLRPIDALPFLYLLGFIVALSTGSRRQRIGDLAAGTRVVPA